MRRLLLSAGIAYLLVAFGFIILIVGNAARDESLVIMAEADARALQTIGLIGIVVTLLVALRILIDGKRRQDLERQLEEPRRRSDRSRAGDADRRA